MNRSRMGTLFVASLSLASFACGSSGDGFVEEQPTHPEGASDSGISASDAATDAPLAADSAPSTSPPDASTPHDASPTGATDADAPLRPTVMLIPGTTITGDYFDTMAARLTADGFTPVVYVPPDLFEGSLAEGAAGIGRAVDARLKETGEARVNVVAECDGGVATRYWLEVLGGAAKVDQVVTFVSAHHGTYESPIGAWVSGYQALDDVTPGSAFLAALNAAPFPAGLQFTSIYSCHDELMVPYTTSIVDGATNVEFCDHWIGHFDGFWDDVVYGRIVATLRGEGDSAPTRY